MDSLNKLLKDKLPHQPSQITAIKQYVLRNYNSDCSVQSSQSHYTLKLPNAALAQKARFDTEDIIVECKLDKKLVIIIRSI